MSADVADKRPIDKFIPWMIVLFFVVLVSLDMMFVVIAVKTNTGIVSETAYEDGLHYNKTLDAAAQQEASGWGHAFDFQRGVLRVTLKNHSSARVAGAVVRAVFSRPVQAGYDFELILDEAANGIYEARPEFPFPGQWTVRIYAKWQEQPYQFSHTIMAP